MRGGVFFEKRKFEELIKLLSQPKINKSAIARHFRCDHSTIFYWVKRIKTMGSDIKYVGIEDKRPQDKVQNPYIGSGKYKPLNDNLFGERINVGKNYLEYVREYEKRNKVKIRLPDTRNRTTLL